MRYTLHNLKKNKLILLHSSSLKSTLRPENERQHVKFIKILYQRIYVRIISISILCTDTFTWTKCGCLSRKTAKTSIWYGEIHFRTATLKANALSEKLCYCVLLLDRDMTIMQNAILTVKLAHGCSSTESISKRSSKNRPVGLDIRNRLAATRAMYREFMLHKVLPTIID